MPNRGRGARGLSNLVHSKEHEESPGGVKRAGQNVRRQFVMALTSAAHDFHLVIGVTQEPIDALILAPVLGYLTRESSEL